VCLSICASPILFYGLTFLFTVTESKKLLETQTETPCRQITGVLLRTKSASRKNPRGILLAAATTVIFSTPQDSAAQESEWTYGNLNKKRSSSVCHKVLVPNKSEHATKGSCLTPILRPIDARARKPPPYCAAERSRGKKCVPAQPNKYK
jgi:hypothetical protein